MLRDNCVSFEGKDLVIDMKGLSYIPSCLDEEPVRSQRALLFQKGSTLHVPGVAGSYVTTKPWQLLVAPLMVKYTEASGIEDELVLSFTDCGLASSTMAGAGIVTLDFPLKVRHNVWKGENEAQMKALHNVVAFYPIDTKKIQYIDVGPCLKHYPPLCKLSIHVPADALTWITRPLAEKVPLLIDSATTAANTYKEQVAATDARGAELVFTKMTAQLQKLQHDFTAIGMESYDMRIRERVVELDLDDETDKPAWIKTPQRGALTSATALREDTLLKARRQLAPPDSAADESTIRANGADAAETGAGAGRQPTYDEHGSVHDGEDSPHHSPPPSPVEEPEELEVEQGGRHSKRARTVVQPFDFTCGTTTGTGGDKHKKSKSKKGEPAAPDEAAPLNRDGQPWKRGPYKTGKVCFRTSERLPQREQKVVRTDSLLRLEVAPRPTQRPLRRQREWSRNSKNSLES